MTELDELFVKPAAITATDLVPTVTAGYVTLIKSITIKAVTAADIELRWHNGTSVYRSIALNISAGDTYNDNVFWVMKAGYKLQVYSTQADTEFSVSVSSDLNATI